MFVAVVVVVVVVVAVVLVLIRVVVAAVVVGWLCAVGCLLLVVRCWLCAVGCLLFDCPSDFGNCHQEMPKSSQPKLTAADCRPAKARLHEMKSNVRSLNPPLVTRTLPEALPSLYIQYINNSRSTTFHAAGMLAFILPE